MINFSIRLEGSVNILEHPIFLEHVALLEDFFAVVVFFVVAIVDLIGVEATTNKINEV